MHACSCCLLAAQRPSNILVYLRDGSAKTILRAATLRQKLQIKLSTSPSHSILTPGWPVPALTLYCQVPGRVATGVPIFKSLVMVWLDLEKSRREQDLNPRSSAFEADALTTRPTTWTRQSYICMHSVVQNLWWKSHLNLRCDHISQCVVFFVDSENGSIWYFGILFNGNSVHKHIAS